MRTSLYVLLPDFTDWTVGRRIPHLDVVISCSAWRCCPQWTQQSAECMSIPVMLHIVQLVPTFKITERCSVPLEWDYAFFFYFNTPPPTPSPDTQQFFFLPVNLTLWSLSKANNRHPRQISFQKDVFYNMIKKKKKLFILVLNWLLAACNECEAGDALLLLCTGSCIWHIIHQVQNNTGA